MKDLIIIGAGDFSREAMWVAERMNLRYPQWNLLGFVDDKKAGETVDGYPVLGDMAWLSAYEKQAYVTCGIGGGARKRLWDMVRANSNIHPATLVDPDAVIGKDCVIGDASIICAGSVMAIASRTGFNCIINLNCTLGHDSILEDFCTVHPGSNISGRVHVGQCAEIGTGTKIIQGKAVGEGAILGAGSVVVRDIPPKCTAVGCPAKPIKFFE